LLAVPLVPMHQLRRYATKVAANKPVTVADFPKCAPTHLFTGRLWSCTSPRNVTTFATDSPVSGCASAANCANLVEFAGSAFGAFKANHVKSVMRENCESNDIRAGGNYGRI
jgi:hypothetical protein